MSTKLKFIPSEVSNFDQLPDSANVRLPVVKLLFGCSAPTIWRWVKVGILPQPRKIGGITVWMAGELRDCLRNIGGEK